MRLLAQPAWRLTVVVSVRWQFTVGSTSLEDQQRVWYGSNWRRQSQFTAPRGRVDGKFKRDHAGRS